MKLTRGFLETLRGEQLDIIHYLVFNHINFEDRETTIDALTDKTVSPDRMELMETLLEAVKKL